MRQAKFKDVRTYRSREYIMRYLYSIGVKPLLRAQLVIQGQALEVALILDAILSLLSFLLKLLLTGRIR